MKLPETRYARSGEVRIAYQVVGNGPIDLVFVPGERLASTQACAYPDGTRVFCAAMIELAGGKITKQTVVQAWDA